MENEYYRQEPNICTSVNMVYYIRHRIIEVLFENLYALDMQKLWNIIRVLFENSAVDMHSAVKLAIIFFM